MVNKNKTKKVKNPVLRKIIEKTVRSTPRMDHGKKTIQIYWHSGEPLLAGINFFQEIINIQNKFPEVVFENRLQTNGTLLDEAFTAFLVVNDFDVGFSIDGPRQIHNLHRKCKGHKNNSFDLGGYYRPKSEEYTRKMKSIKNIGLLIGIVVVFLGALGTTGWTGGWVAFFTTVTASIAAYAYSGRYQYLIISYQATANRLELLQTQWQTSGFTDDDLVQRNRFILNCEEAISIENSAWMAKLVQKGQPANLAKK